MPKALPLFVTAVAPDPVSQHAGCCASHPPPVVAPEAALTVAVEIFVQRLHLAAGVASLPTHHDRPAEGCLVPKISASTVAPAAEHYAEHVHAGRR